mgnify:CR=1 FL=1
MHVETNITDSPSGAEARHEPSESLAAPRSSNSPDSTPEAAVGPVQPRDGTANDYPEPADRWKPTRRVPAHRQAPGPGGNRLTPAQLALADDLHTRALALRAASEEGLSIREAVALAAVQLGLEGPTETGETR